MPHTAAPHEATLAAHGSTQPKRTCNGSAPICNRTKQNRKVLKLKCKMAAHPLTATKHHSNSGCAYGSIGNPRSARRLAPQKHIVSFGVNDKKETRASCLYGAMNNGWCDYYHRPDNHQLYRRDALHASPFYAPINRTSVASISIRRQLQKRDTSIVSLRRYE